MQDGNRTLYGADWTGSGAVRRRYLRLLCERCLNLRDNVASSLVEKMAAYLTDTGSPSSAARRSTNSTSSSSTESSNGGRS